MLGSIVGRVARARLVLTGFVALACATAQAQVSQVVISEVWGGGHQNAETPNADYIEIFNRGSTGVSLSGWSVQVASPAGSTWSVVALPAVTLGAREYYLVRLETAGIGTTFTPDITASPSITVLSFAGGKAALCNSTVALTGNATCPFAAQVVDYVGYGSGGNREPCGSAVANNAPANDITLGAVRSTQRSGGGCQDTGTNVNDFAIAAPTPLKSGNFAPATREFSTTMSPTSGPAGVATPVIVTGYLRDCGAPVTGATVSANLSGFTGLTTLTMLDNGASNDGAANDGVYGGTFNVPAAQGQGGVSVTFNWVKDATNGSDSKTFTVNPPAPANDLCANATDISSSLNGGSYSESLSNISATPDADVTCNTDSVTRFGFWYTFTPSVNGVLSLAESGAQDIVYGVFTFTNGANECGSLVQTSCLATDNVSTQSVVGGTKYYILVGNQTAVAATPGPTDTVDLAFSFAPAPSNDSCAGATVIASLPFSDSVNAPAATDDADVSCNNGTSALLNGVWYKYVATAAGNLTIAENSSADTVRAVFTGASCGALTEILCADAEASSVSVTPGTTYWIVTGQWSATTRPTANYEIAFDLILPPANDTCGTATVVSSFPYTDSVNALGATDDPDTASCNTTTATSILNGVWHTFTPMTAGAYQFSENSSADTIRALYTGPCGSLAEVGCADAETAVFNLSAGTQYWLVTGQWSATTRPTTNYEIAMELLTAPANDLCDGAIDMNAGGADASDGRGATSDAPPSCSSTASGGVWYQFSTGVNQYLSLTVAETSGADALWALYTGSCAGLTEVACNLNDTATFPLEPSTQYHMLLATQGTVNPTAAYAATFTFTAQTRACCNGTDCSIKSRDDCLAGSGTWQAAGVGCGSSLSSTVYSSTNSFPINIPDSGSADSTLTISGTGQMITASGIAVTIGLTHSWCGDIIATISDGTVTAPLISRPGVGVAGSTVGDSSNFGGTYIFYDPSANNLYTASLAGDTGYVIPSGDFQAASDGTGTQVLLGTAFMGRPLDATWTLHVSDNAGIDTGSINSFAVQLASFAGGICSTPPPCPGNHNGDGLVDADDLFAFLDDWFAQNGVCMSGCSADYTGAPLVDADDLFAYLDLWFLHNGDTCP